jgi:4-hydroxyphenylpyruvate dioxygenase-like putative hemolysin
LLAASQISDGAFADTAIDMVNFIDSLADESYLEGCTVVETRGKPIDHFAYSTLDLQAAYDRIQAQGIESPSRSR